MNSKYEDLSWSRLHLGISYGCRFIGGIGGGPVSTWKLNRLCEFCLPVQIWELERSSTKINRSTKVSKEILKNHGLRYRSMCYRESLRG